LSVYSFGFRNERKPVIHSAPFEIGF